MNSGAPDGQVPATLVFRCPTVNDISDHDGVGTVTSRNVRHISHPLDKVVR
jgi:hypothetical protein